jgi:hypothetical protein
MARSFQGSRPFILFFERCQLAWGFESAQISPAAAAFGGENWEGD